MLAECAAVPSQWWRPTFAGRVDERVITSKALTGNPLGDPAERPLLVYVPPGYDNGNRRYPSVYVIQGYTGQAVMWGNRINVEIPPGRACSNAFSGAG